MLSVEMTQWANDVEIICLDKDILFASSFRNK